MIRLTAPGRLRLTAEQPNISLFSAPARLFAACHTLIDMETAWTSQ
jgi:hypothetical protein